MVLVIMLIQMTMVMAKTILLVRWDPISMEPPSEGILELSLSPPMEAFSRLGRLVLIRQKASWRFIAGTLLSAPGRKLVQISLAIILAMFQGIRWRYQMMEQDSQSEQQVLQVQFEFLSGTAQLGR